MKRERSIKLLAVVLVILFTVLAAEGLGQVLYRIRHHYWLMGRTDAPYVELFRKHPFLVADARPDASYVSRGNIRFRHNSLGVRGGQIALAKKEGVKRVLTLGGSSTYCVGVSDNETWPYYLGKKLGEGYEVVNMGIPGYTTVEHIIQTALNISDLSPDICIYYTGWNDARNQHVAGLKSDYSDFHGKAQYNHLMLGAFKVGNGSVIVQTTASLLRRIFVRDPEGVFSVKGTAGKLTAKIDERALDLYTRNLRLLISLCRAQGVRPIMVPQIMNYEALTSDKPYGWLPYVKDKDLKTVIGAYNEAMRKVSVAEKADYAASVLDVKYDRSWFADDVGHFSPGGNERFAEMVARAVRGRP